MENSQKGFASAILIALVVILAGALGYVTLVKKSVPVEQQQTNKITQSSKPQSAVDIISGIGYFLIPKRGEQTNKEFLRTLKGEVIYQHRDNGSFNIYKISATGENNVLLYKNSTPLMQNRNAMNPRLSADGHRISFAATAGKGGRDEYWNRFSMNIDGSNLVQETNYNDESVSKGGDYPFGDLTGHPEASREKDLVVKAGSIYFDNGSGGFRLIYSHKNFNDYDNPGASEVSWSPDKNYVIFALRENGGNEIMIVSKDGTQLAKLANGWLPTWIY